MYCNDTKIYFLEIYYRTLNSYFYRKNFDFRHCCVAKKKVQLFCRLCFFYQVIFVIHMYINFIFIFSAEFEQKCKGNQDQLEADTNRLKEILKRENEERKNELRELEAFTKKENAERKAETEQINSILNAENEKRMKEAQALKDKMEKEKKELQAYLEKVRFFVVY